MTFRPWLFSSSVVRGVARLRMGSSDLMEEGEGVWMRERERKREKERDRQRERERQIETEREREREWVLRVYTRMERVRVWDRECVRLGGMRVRSTCHMRESGCPVLPSADA